MLQVTYSVNKQILVFSCYCRCYGSYTDRFKIEYQKTGLDKNSGAKMRRMTQQKSINDSLKICETFYSVLKL